MSRRPIFPCTLLLVVLSVSVARAQGPGPQADLGDPTARPQSDLVEPKPAVVWPPQTSPSSWILYDQACGDCCGPIGRCGPLRMELFVDTGPSLPSGSEFVSRSLDTGWMVSGGARALFFNRAETAAWSVDLSLNYIWNHASHDDVQTLYPVPVTNALGNVSDELHRVSMINLYRTFVGAGIGREWFLLGPTFTGNVNWIAGIDGGFRYGTARIDMHDFASDSPSGFVRTTDQLYGGYVGLHTDLEIPHNCCTFLVGFRTEWSGMVLRNGSFFNTINDQGLYDVNFLLTLGVRF
jgi:hypothetical protein